jgi:hypothetical protein
MNAPGDETSRDLPPPPDLVKEAEQFKVQRLQQQRQRAGSVPPIEITATEVLDLLRSQVSLLKEIRDLLRKSTSG